jgi:exosortase/archaeosortase family protein
MLAATAFVMIGAGVGAAGTSLLTLLAGEVAPARRAAAGTIVWLMMIMGFAVTAGVAGRLLDPYSPQRLIAITSVVALCAVLLTLAALYAYFAMRTPMRGLVLFGCSLLFAILGNFARVFSVVVFARFFDPKIATGLYHDYSGFVFFPVAVLAMIGAGNVINRDWSMANRGVTSVRISTRASIATARV